MGRDGVCVLSPTDLSVHRLVTSNHACGDLAFRGQPWSEQHVPAQQVWAIVPGRNQLPGDRVDSLVADLFLIVEGADVGRDERFDAVAESSRCLTEWHAGASQVVAAACRQS